MSGGCQDLGDGRSHVCRGGGKAAAHLSERDVFLTFWSLMILPKRRFLEWPTIMQTHIPCPAGQRSADVFSR
jgi:hypothetical protein